MTKPSHLALSHTNGFDSGQGPLFPGVASSEHGPRTDVRITARASKREQCKQGSAIYALASSSDDRVGMVTCSFSGGRGFAASARADASRAISLIKALWAHAPHLPSPNMQAFLREYCGRTQVQRKKGIWLSFLTSDPSRIDSTYGIDWTDLGSQALKGAGQTNKLTSILLR